MELKLSGYQQSLYDNNVEHVWYAKMGNKTTVAVVRIRNGFEVTGTSACVNPDDFDMEIGQHFALVDALSKLDGFLGFSRQEEAYAYKRSIHDVAKEIMDSIREKN